MKFSILFWNIKNYSGGKARTYKLVDYIRQFNPDILCLCEVNDKAALRSRLTEELTDYNFAITDGPGYIELATGWKQENSFEQILFTQRREFQAGQEILRPGALLSVKHSGEFYNILFLHTDSRCKRKDYTNRQTMFEKIGRLKYTLDRLHIFAFPCTGEMAFRTWCKRGCHSQGTDYWMMIIRRYGLYASRTRGKWETQDHLVRLAPAVFVGTSMYPHCTSASCLRKVGMKRSSWRRKHLLNQWRRIPSEQNSRGQHGPDCVVPMLLSKGNKEGLWGWIRLCVRNADQR